MTHVTTGQRRSHRRRVLAFWMVLAVLLVGCATETGNGDQDGTADGDAAPTEPGTEGTDTGDTGDTDAGETVSLTVGDIAGTPSAFLQYAVDEGFFDDEGLDVTVEVSPGGAANVPGVMAGDFELAGSNIVSMILARGEGLPVRMISAGTFAAENVDDDFSAVLVPEDSDIEGPDDLDGRSVAVNTLANIAELTIRAAIENEGASHDSIDFVEMPFPDMIPALQDGRVDAIHVIEPFMSIGLEQGLRSVLVPYAQTRAGVAIGSYFSTDEYIEQNQDVIDRFISAVSAAGDHIADNPDDFRERLPDLADLDPEVADVVAIPPWGGPVDIESVELIAGLMEQFGIISEAPPVDEVVYTQGGQ